MDKPHVLIVDDDVMVLESLSTFFESQGYRVTSADNCQHAREKLQRPDKIDVMILDYLMPDGTGTDLLRSLDTDSALQRPPVIMSSSYLNPENPLWEQLRARLPSALQSLIQAYVSKPYALDAMDMAVHEVLSGDFAPPARTEASKPQTEEKPES